jgi:two-component system chemotaxis response regulator CheY
MANILVVDDAAFMRMMLRDILGKNGHMVVGEATNGKEAIDRYKELRPDLVTMDIVMPDVTGIEAVKGIMKEDSKAKIVMVSALGQQAMVKEAIGAGARDFILKPFQQNQVIQTIQNVLEG